MYVGLYMENCLKSSKKQINIFLSNTEKIRPLMNCEAWNKVVLFPAIAGTFEHRQIKSLYFPVTAQH